MSMIKGSARLFGAMLVACVSFAQAGWAQAQDSPIRIVVVPFYTEEGVQVTDGGYEGRHYRRVLRYINNQLVRRGFEVINPAAHEWKEAEYNRLRERARENSPLAALELTRRFMVDVVYLVWLDVESRMTGDRVCDARVQIEGEGYDSAGRDIGAGVDRIFRYNRRDCRDAVIKAEKLAGDEVGRLLTASRQRSGKKAVDDSGGGVVKKVGDDLADLIDVKLMEATRSELVGVFGRVLSIVRGSLETSPYGMLIDPENPQRSYATWRVRKENTDAFKLQENVMTLLKRVYDAGGEGNFKGVAFRFTPDEVDLLKAIRPYETTSRSLVFLVDRDRAQAIEFSSGYD